MQLEHSKKVFKKIWEPSVVVQVEQRLYDAIKKEYPINSKVPYCGIQLIKINKLYLQS
jgi:hypothetical protein